MKNMVMLNDSYLNNHEYGGSSIKFGITYNKQDYIVKIAEQGDFSVYSEYIASRFIASLGIPVHNVYLAKYQGVYAQSVVDVVVLEDFTQGGALHEFKDTRQSSENTPLEDKGYTYTDICDLIAKHTKLCTSLREAMQIHFWRQFICDAILANRDRHGGNWGYLIKNGRYYPAPIYDNGNSLFPNINKRFLELKALTTKEDLYNFFKDRVYAYPASIIQVYDKELGRNRRTNYADIFSDFRRFPKLGSLVKQLNSKLNIQTVFSNMYNIVKTLDIDVVYKWFYVFIVSLHYLCIVCRLSYDKAYDIVYTLYLQYKN